MVKYILFSYNSDKEEIFQFIEHCKENNVVRVQLDCEFNSASGKYPYPIAITEKEITAAKYFIELCKENNIEYSLDMKWSEYRKEIEES